MLAPYLPRIALDWLADTPERSSRQIGGTVVFVDVSGFTKLTERLAARGKAGAEEITEVIGTVFGGLLEIASAYGADLLKWGGDAVLLLFGGPDAPQRSTRAAVLMSRAMSKIGRFKTSAGQVRLDVSISAHSDVFDVYLLGDRHRELIVTGPAATKVARLEAIAESGEVVVSPETAARLDPRVLGGSKETGVLVTGLPEADHFGALLSGDRRGVEVASLVPAAREKHLRSVAESGVGDDGEHRQATVAFLEYSGIDALTLASGPEAVAAALGPVICRAEAAAERNGVSFHETDIGADGGKIVLVGGVPQVHGNDSERVLRAVREVVTEHPEDSPIRLRSGVNAGRVFVFSHHFSVADRRIFAITGDAVNLAARVMGRAGHGQVVATKAVLASTRNPFETEALAPFSVKGKSEPVVAALVGSPLLASRADGAYDMPFVGRFAELEAILECAHAAKSGSGSVVDILGPAGIGKSRLISEASDRWGLETFRVICDEYESTTPYLPFRRILRLLLGLSDDKSDAVTASELREVVRRYVPDMITFLPLLADVVDVPVATTPEVNELDVRFRRRRLEQLVVDLFRAYLSVPAAFVIEDAHAIDEASAGLLSRMAAEASTLPLLLVCTRRVSTGDTYQESVSSHLVLDLVPLGDSSMHQMVRVEGASPLSSSVMSSIVERAGGNPLFLRELLRSASGAGGIDALPESIEPLLVAQIDQLPHRDRQVLRAASVLGTHFDPDLLEDILEPDTDAPGADIGADVGADVTEAIWTRLSEFVHSDSTGWSFAHTLMRDAAYEGLSFRRRRELHARAASGIEKRSSTPDEAAELLSLHWLNAERYEEAWHCARVAADRARSLWANSEAATFYARAFEAARHLSLPARDVRTVTEALGDAYEVTANYDRARDTYSKARRLCESDVDRARVLRKTGVLHERQGRYPSALACYSRARRMLTGPSRDAATERCELDLAAAGIKDRQGRYVECVGFATEAADQAKAAEHPSGLAHALYLQHMMSVYLGDPEDALAETALVIFEEIGDLVGQGNVLNNLGISSYYRGQWDEALEFYERSASVRLRSGDVVGAATEENNVGEILSDQGEYEEARSLFDSARSAWLAAGYKVGIAFATSNLGRLAVRSGDVDAGRGLLEEALAQFKEINSPIFVAETELRLVECDVIGGNLTGAAEGANRLLDSIQGRAGFEQVEVPALRLLSTSRLLESGPRDPDQDSAKGHEPRTPGAMLDYAIDRSAAMGATYELAVGLATRAALSGLVTGATRADSARERISSAEDNLTVAEEIFSRLGVKQAVINWSNQRTGVPLFAYQKVSADI